MKCRKMIDGNIVWFGSYGFKNHGTLVLTPNVTNILKDSDGFILKDKIDQILISKDEEEE